MRALSPWQSWRFRCLPFAKSVASRPPSRSPPSTYLLSLNSYRLRGCRFITSQSKATPVREVWIAEEIKDRVDELQEAEIDPYPRSGTTKSSRSSVSKLDRTYNTLKRGERKESVGRSSYQGRIESVRTAGRLLFFVDISRKQLKLQILVNHTQMLDSSTDDEFIARRKLLRRGDIISVVGYPYRAQSGQLSLSATELPSILSPCLHQFPVQKPIEETNSEHQPQFLDKHVDMLANHHTTQLIIRRSQIVRQMRDFLNRGGFAEVQTPILSAAAGGAIARPFETSATESSGKQLALRIAPELWLKRLILGGMDRIFEIGPCFRNEGLDKTHNVEFTTCEFYSAYSSIQDLLQITEKMLYAIVRNIESQSAEGDDDPTRLPRSKMPPLAVEARFFKGPYPRLDFIPALNEALGRELPDLDSESATAKILSIVQEKNLALPAHPNLPRLLDKLSATYLEPQCDKPTWIVNHPECLSPLSKSVFDPTSDVAQPLAARAELFVHGREIVNCYEEENSPFEQRRKFMSQRKYANTGDSKAPDPEAMEVDEAYLKALEWGLPPTGGWGCGIDRLVMLLTGKQRINDVLTFGNLRSVTRTPESRALVRLGTLPVAAKEGRKDSVQAEKSPSEENRPPLDAAEAAVEKIKKKIYKRKEKLSKGKETLSKGKSGRSKQRKDERVSSAATQKRLAVWLAGRGSTDAAESIVND